MKKYVKFVLCGMAAAALVTGCSSKKPQESQSTAAETVTEASSEPESGTEAEKEVDKGTVTKLGQYKGVEVKRLPVEVSDEELDARIQSILDANPEYIEITDRAAKLGDVVNIDYVGMKDGEAFDGGTAEGYDLELGSQTFIDGFEDGLVGVKTGEERSLNLTFPEAYHSEELAGQEVVFDVTVNRIEEKREAVLDDNFVQRMSDFSTVDEFKADTLAEMEAERESQADQQIEADALQKALDNSEFDVNQEAVEDQFQKQMEYYNSMVQLYGMNLADYVAMFGMTEEQFQEELKSAAETAIRQQLLIDAIAEAENLQVEDADRELVAKEYGTDVEALKASYGEEAVDETAKMYKVIGFIRDNAVVK